MHFSSGKQHGTLKCIASLVSYVRFEKERFEGASHFAEAMTHRSNLDFLRMVAVMTVVAHHLTLTLHTHLGVMAEEHRHFVAALGHSGVLAFFVHTSLVLMFSLERMHQKSSAVTFSFYIRRAFRIYPLAIATILVAVLLHLPYKTWDVATPVNHAAVVANLLLVQNIWTKQSVLGPLWSLPYEVQMYVLLPFLYLLARRRNGSTLLLGLFGAFAAIGVCIALRTSHLNFFAYVPCFLAGVLCYSLRDRIRPVLPAWSWPVWILAIFAGFVLTSFQEEPAYWAGWVFCLLIGLSIHLFHDSKSESLNYVSARAALYSYGIYLLHVPALYLVFLYFHIRSLWLGPLLFVSVTWCFAVAAFHALESPMIEVGRRLSDESAAEARLTEPAPEVSRL